MFFETPTVGSIYIAMVYLLILNSTILILSKDKRWTFVKYLSFFLNIPTSIYLMFNSNSDLLSLLYSFTTFFMYLAIILRNPVQRSLELKLPELILLGLNTAINALISYTLFDILAWKDFNGLLALIYGITYFILGRFIGKKDYKSNKTSDLFYLTSLTFAILGVIPLFLINHFNLSNMNFIISSIFIVLSFVYIMYGFNKHFVLIRRFGLFLSMFSTAKLFIFDLMFLNTLGRIVAYLSFGITLIAISYIYQRLKTKTESTTIGEED